MIKSKSAALSAEGRKSNAMHATNGPKLRETKFNQEIRNLKKNSWFLSRRVFDLLS